MIVIETAISVACTPEAAFDFVANGFFENLARWNPALVWVRQTAPDL